MVEVGGLLAGRYLVLEAFPGTGATRRYAAQSPEGNPVAVLEGGAETSMQLIHVAAVLRSISHPVLPPLIETFEVGPTMFLVLDVPTGRPLTEAWLDPSVPDRPRLEWIRSICDALDALRRKGATLMALVPESLVVHDGNVVLADPSQIAILPLGSAPPDVPPFYTAPEVLTGPARATTGAEVYAVGALLTSLLVGRPLTEEDLPGGGPRRIREVLPSVAPEVEGLLLAAMDPDPFSRPISPAIFSELLGTLDGLLAPRWMAGGASNIGLLRPANEDRFLLKVVSRQLPETEVSLILMAVADGIGGEDGGATASHLALDWVESDLAGFFDSILLDGTREPTDEEAWAALQHAADSAERAIRERAEADEGVRNMGTTLALAVAVGSRAYCGNIGDSRIYLLQQGSLLRVSEDHTVSAEMVRQGQLDLDEERYHAAHGHLTRALGSGAPALAFRSTETEEGDALLLCSDGLTNVLTDEEIARVLAADQDPETLCRHLVQLANLQGGPDNITVVALRRVPRRVFGYRGVSDGLGAAHCSRCGASNAEGARFCQACGTAMQGREPRPPGSTGIYCPYCRAFNPQEIQVCGTCGQLLPLPNGSLVASRFNILKMLGQGGMGRTYLVRDQAADEVRVLKEMVTDIHTSPAQRQRYEQYFRNESDIQSRLRGLQGVPRLLEPCQEYGGRLFFLMEYVPGEDLATLLKRNRRPFSAEAVRRWAIQICEVLTVLHTYRPGAAILHRDITPDNLYLRGEDLEVAEVVLIDFGIARLARRGRQVTQGLGKPGYAAPEQLLGRTEPRSDLYSLAATLHFLLTGSDQTELPSPLPPARELNPSVPKWFSALIARNLSQDVEARHPSAATMASDLRRRRSGGRAQQPSVAGPSPQPARG